jgi:hypothetical protein
MQMLGQCVRMHGLCVVVVEVIAPIRPNRAVGSARSTPRSSIACARSSRMRPPRALDEVAPSVPRPVADLVVTSRVSRPPRTVTRAQLRDTSKKPRNTDAAGGDRQTTHEDGGGTPARLCVGGFERRVGGAPAATGRSGRYRALRPLPGAPAATGRSGRYPTGRTATPARARCSLTSATVCWP